jgi:hypothetical protein
MPEINLEGTRTYYTNIHVSFCPLHAAAPELLEAAQLKRNTLIQEASGFEGEWVAVPREDFEKLRTIVAKAQGR